MSDGRSGLGGRRFCTAAYADVDVNADDDIEDCGCC